LTRTESSDDDRDEETRIIFPKFYAAREEEEEEEEERIDHKTSSLTCSSLVMSDSPSNSSYRVGEK
jgi:hypothetical protein